MPVRFIRVIISSCSTMAINTNLHLTHKLEMTNIKVKGRIEMDSAHRGVYASEVWKSSPQ